MLIVDEAQSLPSELLDEVRLLTNIEMPSEKLLSLVIAGQPEIADRLNEPSFRQLKQRIALRCELRPLDLKESVGYIAGRIAAVGGESRADVHARGGRAHPRVLSRHSAHDQRPRRQRPARRFRRAAAPGLTQLVREVCRDFDISTAAQVAPQEPARAPRRRRARSTRR